MIGVLSRINGFLGLCALIGTGLKIVGVVDTPLLRMWTPFLLAFSFSVFIVLIVKASEAAYK